MATRAFSRLGLVNIYSNPGVKVADPRSKPIFPYAVGGLASGVKILTIFGPITRKFGIRSAYPHRRMFAHAGPPTDSATGGSWVCCACRLGYHELFGT